MKRGFLFILTSIIINFTACDAPVNEITYNNPNDPDGVAYNGGVLTVTYNGNGNTGGSVSVYLNNYQQGQTVTVLGNAGNLVKSGYTYNGWNTKTDGSGSTYTQGQTFVMGMTSATLYAKWTTNTGIPDIYAGGYSVNSSDIQVAGYWKNGTWNGLTPLDSTKNSWVMSLVVVGSDVYVGGYSTNSSAVQVAGYWKNGIWYSLTPLDSTKNTWISSLMVVGTDIYAGGWSVNSSGVQIPGYWKNGIWYGLTPIDSTKSSWVYPLVVVGTDVYAGGMSTNSSAIQIAGYWKNGTWNSPATLDTTKNSWLESLVVVGSDVYAGGYISANSSNLTVPGYWKNGTWNGLTPLDLTKHSWVRSLVVVGSDVYAGGSSTNSSVIQVPGYWKNGIWIGLTALDSSKNSGISTLVVVGSDVYAGGNSTKSSNVLVPGYWKNGIWYGLTPIDSTKNSLVSSLVVVVPSPGYKLTFTAAGVSFNMAYMSGSITFPTGTNDAGTATVTKGYWIGDTEVTYELWSTVYTWATAHGYNFANAGVQGGGTGTFTNQHPVTTINWRDAIVWCNALTEWYNTQNSTSYSYTYYSDVSYTTPLRDSRDGE